MFLLEKSYARERCAPCERYQPQLSKASRMVNMGLARTGMALYLETLVDMLDESSSLAPEVKEIMKECCDFCGGYSIYNRKQLEELRDDAVSAMQKRRNPFYAKVVKYFRGLK
jgi:hypothetical protein